MSNSERAVVGAAEVGLEHVALAVLDALAHARPRAMISRPTRALPGRSSTVACSPSWRLHSSAENQPCAPATSSSPLGCSPEPDRFGDFRAPTAARSRTGR